MNAFLKKYWWVLIVLSPLILLISVYSIWFIAIFMIAWWEIVIMLCSTFGEWVLSILSFFIHYFDPI